MTVRVVLAEDHAIVRAGLRALLERTDDIVVVGEAENGRAALAAAGEHHPDVVVMDVSMPELNGVDATRQLAATAERVRIVALSAHTDSRFVAAMLAAGAAGYVAKDSAPEELPTAIRQVAAGRMFLSSRVTAGVVHDYLGRLRADEPALCPELTPRERDVVQLLAEGCNTREVARRIGVSTKTVDNHRSRIMRKLGLNSVAALTKYAIREGLASLDG